MHVVVVHAKAPLPGFAKSRLVSDGITQALAAAFADAFLHDTLKNVRDAGPDEVILHFTPDSEAPYFHSLDALARVVAQPDLSFGERVKHAFRVAFAAGATRVVIIGADTPHLPPGRIVDAFAALKTHDGVIGRALDGGYYLLGLGRPCDSLFDGIEWSAAGVFAATIARAASAGLTIDRLPDSFDVDTVDDLERLRAVIANDPLLCPHTASRLSSACPHPVNRDPQP